MCQLFFFEQKNMKYHVLRISPGHPIATFPFNLQILLTINQLEDIFRTKPLKTLFLSSFSKFCELFNTNA